MLFIKHLVFFFVFSFFFFLFLGENIFVQLLLLNIFLHSIVYDCVFVRMSIEWGKLILHGKAVDFWIEEKRLHFIENCFLFSTLCANPKQQKKNTLNFLRRNVGFFSLSLSQIESESRQNAMNISNG